MFNILFSGAGDILATVFGSLTGIITAVTAFVVKVRGRSWREIIRKIITGKDKEVEDLRKAFQEQSLRILDLSEKLVLERKKNGSVSEKKDEKKGV